MKIVRSPRAAGNPGVAPDTPAMRYTQETAPGSKKVNKKQEIA
jgi:hypothetical protein